MFHPVKYQNIIRSDMTTIRTWEDVKPFAGGVVAYRTDAYYFLGRDRFLDSDPSVQFGYIKNEVSQWGGGQGYQLSRLVFPKDIPYLERCPLHNRALALQSPIEMRLVTPEELVLVLDLIHTDKILKFENGIDIRISP